MFTTARFLNGSLATVANETVTFAEIVNRCTREAATGTEVPGITWGSKDHTLAWVDTYGNRHDVVVVEGEVNDTAALYAAAGIEVAR